MNMRVGLIVEEYPGSSERFVYDAFGRLEAGEIVVFARRSAAPALITDLTNIVSLAPDGAGTGRRLRRATSSARALTGALAHRHPSTKLVLGDIRRSITMLEYAQLLREGVSSLSFESPRAAYRYARVDQLGLPFTVSVSSTDVSWFKSLSARDRSSVQKTVASASAALTTSYWTFERFNGHLPLQLVTPSAPACYTRRKVTPKPIVFLDGPLDYRAGIENSLLVLRTLADRGVPFAVRVSGDGPLLRYYRFIGERLGLAPSIRWLGALRQADYEREITAADVLVTSSIIDDRTHSAALAKAGGAFVPEVSIPRDRARLAQQIERALEYTP